MVRKLAGFMKPPPQVASKSASGFACSTCSRVLPSRMSCQTRCRTFVGDDQGAGFAEVLIPPGMVPMPVGVEYEFNGLIRDGSDGGQNLLSQWRVLVVNDEG